jgi:alpha-D-xyloside xylohydrolase
VQTRRTASFIHEIEKSPRLNYNEKGKRLTVGERKGEFPGMLKKRTIEIVWISKRKPTGLDFSAKPDAVVTYDGNPQTIRTR